MNKHLFRRALSALMILCIMIGLLPANSFAALRTRNVNTTRAATDLTSVITNLSKPVEITNKFYRSLTNATNDGSYAGTFYIFLKDDNGSYHVLNPLGIGSKGAITTVPVTYSNNSVSGADLSMAIDIVHSSTNTYHFRTSDERYFSGWNLENIASIAITSTPRDPLGLQFITSSSTAANTSNTANTLRIYRVIDGVRYDMPAFNTVRRFI